MGWSVRAAELGVVPADGLHDPEADRHALGGLGAQPRAVVSSIALPPWYSAKISSRHWATASGARSSSAVAFSITPRSSWYSSPDSTSRVAAGRAPGSSPSGTSRRCRSTARRPASRTRAPSRAASRRPSVETFITRSLGEEAGDPSPSYGSGRAAWPRSASSGTRRSSRAPTGGRSACRRRRPGSCAVEPVLDQVVVVGDARLARLAGHVLPARPAGSAMSASSRNDGPPAPV